MARTFGSYSPSVPLGLTWEESIELADENGASIDLSGYDVVAEIYAAAPVRDPGTGLATAAPVLQITTAGYHGSDPAWDVSEGATIPVPADGTIVLSVSVDDVWLLSPTNVTAKLRWAIILVNPDTGYRLPVVTGRVSVTPSNVVTP
jgi:hypothetical protein